MKCDWNPTFRLICENGIDVPSVLPWANPEKSHMPPVKILIAQSPRALAKTERSFTGYEIFTAFDLKAADYWMQRHELDAFIIGVHFDDSRGVELASLIRANAKHKDRPIVIVRLLASENAQLFRTTLDALVQTGIINQYLEFEETEAEIPEKIRAAVDQQIHNYKKQSHANDVRNS